MAAKRKKYGPPEPKPSRTANQAMKLNKATKQSIRKATRKAAMKVEKK